MFANHVLVHPARVVALHLGRERHAVDRSFPSPQTHEPRGAAVAVAAASRARLRRMPGDALRRQHKRPRQLHRDAPPSHGAGRRLRAGEAAAVGGGLLGRDAVIALRRAARRRARRQPVEQPVGAQRVRRHLARRGLWRRVGRRARAAALREPGRADGAAAGGRAARARRVRRRRGQRLQLDGAALLAVPHVVRRAAAPHRVGGRGERDDRVRARRAVGDRQGARHAPAAARARLALARAGARRRRRGAARLLGAPLALGHLPLRVRHIDLDESRHRDRAARAVAPPLAPLHLRLAHLRPRRLRPHLHHARPAAAPILLHVRPPILLHQSRATPALPPYMRLPPCMVRGAALHTKRSASCRRRALAVPRPTPRVPETGSEAPLGRRDQRLPTCRLARACACAAAASPTGRTCSRTSASSGCSATRTPGGGSRALTRPRSLRARCSHRACGSAHACSSPSARAPSAARRHCSRRCSRSG
eukprot:7383731-Prymnesium_polylepis.2